MKMKRIKRIKRTTGRTLSALALLGVVGVVGAWFAKPVVAQVRAALVRDVDAPALSPFRATVNYQLCCLNDQRLLTTVPAGKRLVIEHISYLSFGPTGDQLVYAALRAGQFGPVHLVMGVNPLHASASSSFTIQDASQPVRAYFEAGEEVWVSASHNTGGNRQFELHVAGYYVTP